MTEEQKKSLRANFQEDQNLGVVPTATYTAPNSIYNVPKTLTSDLLAPSSNMNLNVPAQTSVAPAMQGTLEAQAEATKVANEEKQRLAQQSNDVVAKEEVKNKSLREYVAGLFGSSGETAIRDQEYTNNKVDVAKNELNEINNELLTEQNALRRRIEETEKTFGGTTSGLQTEINRLKNESLSKQADLSIIQMAKQNNFSAVKEIADRAVALKLEQQKQTNEILKFVYEENKDLFTKAEQRQFEEAQKGRDREYEEKLSKEKDLSEIKQSLLKSASAQNAPASVLRAIQGSGTSEEAIVAAGQYAGDVIDRDIKRAQLVKLNAEIAKIKSETSGTSVTFDTSTPEGKLASVAQNIASKFSSKFSQEQFLSNVKRLSASGDVQQLADYVFSEAISNIGDPEARKKAFGNYRITKQLSMLEQQLSDYASRGGDTNILVGKKEDVLANIGLVQNAELRSIGTSIMNTLDELARARTGAVISESEEKMYRKILPGIDKTGPLNEAIISGLKSSLTNDLDSILSFQLTGTGFDSIKDYLSGGAGYRTEEKKKTVNVEGREFIVGQVYNDRKANWTVDENGEWTKLSNQ